MSRIASAFVEISTRQQKLNTELAQAKGKVSTWLGGVRREVGSAGGGIFAGLLGGVGLGAGFAAFTSIESAIEALVEHAAAAEESQIKLRATLRATGNEIPQNVARLNELADALRENANVSPETTRSLASLGINLGVSARGIDAYIKAAVGLAEATGGDATEAMEKLIKASQGSFKALEKQLPILKSMHTNEEKLAYIQKIAGQGLKERNAQLNTVKGSSEQLHLAMQELEIATATAISPALTASAHAATAAIKALTIGTLENMQFSAGVAAAMGIIPIKTGAAIAQMVEKQKRANEEASKASALTTGDLEKQLGVAEKLGGAFSDITDVWKRAQEAALKGTGAIATAQADASKSGAPTAGGTGQRGNAPGGSTTKPTTAPAGQGGIAGNPANSAAAAIAAVAVRAMQGAKSRNEGTGGEFTFPFQAGGKGGEVSTGELIRPTDEELGYERLKYMRDQLQNQRGGPDEAAQIKIEKINNRMIELLNQKGGGGTVEGGELHRKLGLMDQQLDKNAAGFQRQRTNAQNATETELAQLAGYRQKILDAAAAGGGAPFIVKAIKDSWEKIAQKKKDELGEKKEQINVTETATQKMVIKAIEKQTAVLERIQKNTATSGGGKFQ